MLEIQRIKKYFQVRDRFGIRKNKMLALNDINLSVGKGRTLGLVGESGCGKTTLSKIICGLENPDEGRLVFEDKELNWQNKNSRNIRRQIQMIFQDPYSSLNPRMDVGSIVGEPMRIWGCEKNTIEKKVDELLESVGLGAEDKKRMPGELSGGMRQRVNIARALALSPELIICDEPVSALDVSIQATILNLLIDLKEQYALTYIFISHDLAVVRFISDDLAVMRKGEIVEKGLSTQIYENPSHPYTKTLIDHSVSTVRS